MCLVSLAGEEPPRGDTVNIPLLLLLLLLCKGRLHLQFLLRF